MTNTQTNVLADALCEKARISQDQSVSSALTAVADVVRKLGVEALQGPQGVAGPQGEVGPQGPQGNQGNPGKDA
jgi:hypothetical protein